MKQKVWHTRTYNDAEKLALELSVINGGGKFVAIMDCAPYSEDLVLFDSPTTRSSLALPVSMVDWESVQARIAASDAEFAKAKGGN